MTQAGEIKPHGIAELEAVYDGPSRAGFGSAVFFAQLSATDDLERIALEKYRFFVGDLWERYGEDAWMGSWRKVYARHQRYGDSEFCVDDPGQH